MHFKKSEKKIWEVRPLLKPSTSLSEKQTGYTRFKSAIAVTSSDFSLHTLAQYTSLESIIMSRSLMQPTKPFGTNFPSYTSLGKLQPNRTFSIAFCYLTDEDNDGYLWAIQMLRKYICDPKETQRFSQ
ncbi:hypothetical protein PGTUg99_001057 [Puccinia graminis f. sp. tritici]|uniref:Uncharacterized protein n=1 Tax=Puccinia graminis f. sp. tritici TaxID=56615 RepID=A0A5B0RW38_PUCGR|nr:hypothetical protein PGTUg99_001057 [Puccinia graminis f. sp. tritici]